MRCLSRVEVQEYIDKEIGAAAENEVHMHLKSCDKCIALYDEAIEDKAFINNLFSEVVSEKNSDAVPVFKLPVKKEKKKIYFTVAAVLVAASMIGFIFLFRQNKEHVLVQIPESELLMYEYYDGKDLNKLWHDKSQLLIIEDDKGLVLQSTITY